MLNRMLVEALTRAGYTNLTMCSNGAEAWNILKKYKDTGFPLSNFVSVVITDVEMPQMDGHRLLRLIRDDEVLKDLPVIVFSSIIDDDMRYKGEKLGATAQLSKAELAGLVHAIDTLLM